MGPVETLKMFVAAGITFVRFTAQICNAINWQGTAKGDFWHIGGMAPLAPQSAYKPYSRWSEYSHVNQRARQ